MDTHSDWWVATAPVGDDVADLAALSRRHEAHVRGASSASAEAVESDVVGWGAATRRHLLARGPDGAARGWASVHDRAAGRVLASVVVDPELPDREADPLAEALFEWTRRQAVSIAAESGAADDPARHRRVRGGRAPAAVARGRRAAQGAYLVADVATRPPRRRGAGGVSRRARRCADPAGRTGPGRDARPRRPADGARRARSRLRRPLQLLRGDVRRVLRAAACRPGAPVGPLVAGGAGRRGRRSRRGRPRAARASRCARRRGVAWSRGPARR